MKFPMRRAAAKPRDDKAVETHDQIEQGDPLENARAEYVKHGRALCDLYRQMWEARNKLATAGDNLSFSAEAELKFRGAKRFAPDFLKQLDWERFENHIAWVETIPVRVELDPNTIEWCAPHYDVCLAKRYDCWDAGKTVQLMLAEAWKAVDAGAGVWKGGPTSAPQRPLAPPIEDGPDGRVAVTFLGTWMYHPKGRTARVPVETARALFEAGLAGVATSEPYDFTEEDAPLTKAKAEFVQLGHTLCDLYRQLRLKNGRVGLAGDRMCALGGTHYQGCGKMGPHVLQPSLWDVFEAHVDRVEQMPLRGEPEPIKIEYRVPKYSVCLAMGYDGYSAGRVLHLTLAEAWKAIDAGVAVWEGGPASAPERPPAPPTEGGLDGHVTVTFVVDWGCYRADTTVPLPPDTARVVIETGIGRVAA